MKSTAFDITRKYLKPADTAPMIATTTKADDPVVGVDQWYPEFHRLHMAVVREVSDFDYIKLRETHPDLYQRVKAVESKIDRLGPARLSEVAAIMSEWRGLMIDGFWEQLRARRRTRC